MEQAAIIKRLRSLSAFGAAVHAEAESILKALHPKEEGSEEERLQRIAAEASAKRKAKTLKTYTTITI